MASTFPLTINVSSGGKSVLTVSSSFTVLELKSKIALPLDKEGLDIPLVEQRLIYRGRVLKDDAASLESLGIAAGGLFEADGSFHSAAISAPEEREL